MEKKNKTEEERKKENSTELQKPSVEAEVYSNNKKCDWGKKEKLKSLIEFHSANKIDNYNGDGRGGKKEKKSKWFYRTSQKIRIINVFLELLLSESFPSLGVTVHLSPPRMPSNTVLISGPAVGAAQILIWSSSCMSSSCMSYSSSVHSYLN